MTSIMRANRQLWVLAALVVLVCVAIPLPFYLDHQRTVQQRKDLKCISNWANATAARNDLISRLNTAKNAAADDTFRAVAARDPARFNAALAKYLKASNAYNVAVVQNPLPPSPKFQCGGGVARADGAPVVTRTVSAAGPARTVGATRTVAAARVTATVSSSPRPGAVVTATRTRTIPGPVRTVTFIPAAETVTRTVTAHPSPCILIICLGGNP